MTLHIHVEHFIIFTYLRYKVGGRVAKSLQHWSRVGIEKRHSVGHFICYFCTISWFILETKIRSLYHNISENNNFLESIIQSYNSIIVIREYCYFNNDIHTHVIMQSYVWKLSCFGKNLSKYVIIWLIPHLPYASC